MTDKHPLSDELRKLADLARRQSDDAGPDEIAYALRQAADEIERLQSPPSMDLWARRVGILTTERDSLKQQLVDTRAMNEVNCETLRRWHQRAEAAEAREAGLREVLEWYAARPRTEFTPFGAIDYAHDPEPAREALRAHEKAADLNRDNT